MMEKKNRPATENDVRRRFGAAAFVETFDVSENEDSEATILSLDSLRAAFASVNEEDCEDKVGAENEFAESGDFFEDENFGEPADLAEVAAEHTVELSPKNIFEAMLFVGDQENRPLRADRAAEKMRNVTAEEIDQIAVQLDNEYGRLGCPYRVQRDEDGYRLVMRPEFQPILEKFYGKTREATLSQQALDTLAVVAYRQPMNADDVQKIRKQPSATILSQLVRRGLIESFFEGQGKKQTALYRTTERFLELFHLDSLDDLPTAEDIGLR